MTEKERQEKIKLLEQKMWVALDEFNLTYARNLLLEIEKLKGEISNEKARTNH